VGLTYYRVKDAIGVLQERSELRVVNDPGDGAIGLQLLDAYGQDVEVLPVRPVGAGQDAKAGPGSTTGTVASRSKSDAPRQDMRRREWRSRKKPMTNRTVTRAKPTLEVLIRRWTDGKTLVRAKSAKTIGQAVELAVKRGISLRNADLQGAAQPTQGPILRRRSPSCLIQSTPCVD
jgi:hypothetical protein